MHDSLIPGILVNHVKAGPYNGIGEIHLFSPDKENSNFKKILEIANQNKLPVLLHGDRGVVKLAFKWIPELTIIWAHLGEDPNVKILDRILNHYPNLYIDTSTINIFACLPSTLYSVACLKVHISIYACHHEVLPRSTSS